MCAPSRNNGRRDSECGGIYVPIPAAGQLLVLWAVRTRTAVSGTCVMLAVGVGFTDSLP